VKQGPPCIRAIARQPASDDERRRLRRPPCPRLRLRAAPRDVSARLTRARPAAGRAVALPALPPGNAGDVDILDACLAARFAELAEETRERDGWKWVQTSTDSSAWGISDQLDAVTLYPAEGALTEEEIGRRRGVSRRQSPAP